jgi:hypothetical protein
LVRYVDALSRAPLNFGPAEESAWSLDGGKALEVARQAAKAAVVQALQPMYDAAQAELAAARQERGELVRTHRG